MSGPKGGAKPTDSLRQRIGAAPAVKSETVRVDEWGVDVEVRGLVLGARSRLMEKGYTQKDPPIPIYEKFYAMLLAGSCFEPGTGLPVFVDDKGEPDEAFINSLSPAAVDQVAAVALRLSGLDKPAAGALGNGSGETPSGGSSSPSRGS